MTEQLRAAIWNGAVGDGWVRHADRFDEYLAPFGEAVLERLVVHRADRVLDVGCGTGATSFALAASVPDGHVVGVDVSSQMIAEANRRAASRPAVANAGEVRFVEADVQSAALGEAAFEVCFSRLGVMFFGDPQRAFANLARTMSPGGRLGFVCFQEASRNPFIVAPIASAAEHLALGPPPDPAAPGPFSLADPDRTTSLLEAAGFADVAVTAGPDGVVLAGADDLDALALRMLEQNPVTAEALIAVSPSARAAAVRAAAGTLAEHRDGDAIRMGAASWIVLARTPG